MSKNEIKGNTGNQMRKHWPKNCIWPAPIGEYGGIDWDEDIIPDELDVATQELVDIKDYFDDLRDKGILNEDYSLNFDYDDDLPDGCESIEDFTPEMGEDYWDDGFITEAWQEDLSNALNFIKIDVQTDTTLPDPISDIGQKISYHFINENLLRQAFTRRAFQQEYHLSGCSEELEFLGDSILSLHVTKELMKHFAHLSVQDTEAPFQPKYDEGEFSRLKAKFVCKEHLAKRCETLGLDAYILYATGEEHTESSREDAIEALIGAVAIDCDWNWDVLEAVIDNLIDLQINKADEYLKKSYYEIFNAWHQKHFGFLPEYQVYKNHSRKSWLDRPYDGVIKFCIPENDQGISTGQSINYDGETRSQTREFLAECAYDFVVYHGLWLNMKDAQIIPELENSINQLQEMFQKGYIEKAEYAFERRENRWNCICVVNGIQGKCERKTKNEAKKYAAYEALVLLLKSAGCCDEEWYNEMIKKMFECKVSEADIVEDPTVTDKKGQENTEQSTVCDDQPFPYGPVGLKYNGLVAVLNQIPAGSVITEKVLLQWLGAAYGIENLQIQWSEIPRAYAREQGIPFHRFLTSKGLVDESYVEKVKAEGHEVVETKTTNWRILDYKETMVDVKKLSVPDEKMAIGYAEHYLKFVSAEFKEMLAKGLEGAV